MNTKYFILVALVFIFILTSSTSNQRNTGHEEPINNKTVSSLDTKSKNESLPWNIDLSNNMGDTNTNPHHHQHGDEDGKCHNFYFDNIDKTKEAGVYSVYVQNSYY